MPVSNRSARPFGDGDLAIRRRVAAVAQVEQRRELCRPSGSWRESRPGRQSQGAGSRWAMTSMAPNDSSAAASGVQQRRDRFWSSK